MPDPMVKIALWLIKKPYLIEPLTAILSDPEATEIFKRYLNIATSDEQPEACLAKMDVAREELHARMKEVSNA